MAGRCGSPGAGSSVAGSANGHWLEDKQLELGFDFITCMRARSEVWFCVTCAGALIYTIFYSKTRASCLSARSLVTSASMSFLRRRFGGGDTSSEPSREPSPNPASTERPSNLRVITAEQLHTLQQKGKAKNGKRKNFWIFGLGGVFGLIIAAFFAGSNDLIDLKSIEGMNLESLMEALPANFVKSAQQLQVWITQAYTGRALTDQGVETRTRCCQLRFLCYRYVRAQTGYSRPTSRHHDTRCHLNRSRVVEHRRRRKAIFPQEAMGLVDHDACAGS